MCRAATAAEALGIVLKGLELGPRPISRVSGEVALKWILQHGNLLTFQSSSAEHQACFSSWGDRFGGKKLTGRVKAYHGHHLPSYPVSATSVLARQVIVTPR